MEDNILFIADSIKQLNNFALLANLMLQITLGFLLGYKIGEV